MRQSRIGRSSACSECDDGRRSAKSSPERGGGPRETRWRGPACPPDADQAGKARAQVAAATEPAGGAPVESAAIAARWSEVSKAVLDWPNDCGFRLFEPSTGG